MEIVENGSRSHIIGGAVGVQKWYYGQKYQKCNIPRKHVFYTFQRSLIIFQKIGFSLIFHPFDLEIFLGSVKSRSVGYFEQSLCSQSSTHDVAASLYPRNIASR